MYVVEGIVWRLATIMLSTPSSILHDDGTSRAKLTTKRVGRFAGISAH